MAVIERIPMLQYQPVPAPVEEVTLKQKELERLIDVSPMTVHLWRKAEDPLPCRTIPTGGGGVRVIFVLDEVAEWLSRNREGKFKLLKKRIGGMSNGGHSATERTGRDSVLGAAREAA